MNATAEVLGLSAAEIGAGGATWTAREIAQQPQLWPAIAHKVAADAALANFVGPLLGDARLRVVLSGAGTSSFIGECLAPALARSGLCAEAIATTDIVTSPGSTLGARAPTLMVHFARSGNSPESVAALDLAEHSVADCAHLVITCNPDGELYRRAGEVKRAHRMLLPECNDQSFAMTSSFTGMLLAAALALRAVPADSARVATLAALGIHTLSAGLPLLQSLVRAQFERVVYLGSNELRGLAHEAALKMLELTDGRVVSAGDSPMGFRHGPKTLLNGSTLVVVFLSNQPHTRRYDLDLLAELRGDGVAGRVIALSSRADLPGHADSVTLGTPPGAQAAALTDLELSLPYVVFAQSLAMLRSMSLGLSPDSPNAAGKVHRVVRGVSIYPYGSSA